MTLCLCIVQGEFEYKKECEDWCLVVLLNDNLCIVQGEFEDKNESEDWCLVVLLNDNPVCVLPREGSSTRRRLWTASSPPLRRTQKPRKQVSLKSSF